MSGSTRSSADLDVRRRRNLFRAWHRGIREMDLIMGRFADAEIGTLSEEDLSEFEPSARVRRRVLNGTASPALGPIKIAEDECFLGPALANGKA